MNLVPRVFVVAAVLMAGILLPIAFAVRTHIDSPAGLMLLVPIVAGLSYLLARLTRREIVSLVSRVAEDTSQMAASGRIETPFASEGSPPEVRILQQAFHHLVNSLEDSQRDRERSYVEAIGAVVAAVDARDHETTGHSFRVAHYALELARAMGIDDREHLRAIEWGALLHDVGKIAMPDAILRKVGPLTEDEWAIMRQHPNWGYEILADVQFLKPALAIVYSHHERWDGAGYPRGLSNEQIPLTARIFAVVDTYDAITSDRYYRRARGHTVAATELLRVADSQLDPRVVMAFLGISELRLRHLRDISSRIDGGLSMPLGLPVSRAEEERRDRAAGMAG